MYNQVNISSGHSINCQGASDIINEVEEAIKVVDRVCDLVKETGKKCNKYHDTASSSNTNLSNIVFCCLVRIQNIGKLKLINRLNTIVC